MRYPEFERIMALARLNRYLFACGNDTKKAMVLYRLNLRLSQELFTVISCFEITLRNSIDNHFTSATGTNWLQSGASVGGIFDNSSCYVTARTINETIAKLNHLYSHNKLVAELGFGFWRYMFAPNQYAATGKTLLRIFPSKPKSTLAISYNQTHVFNQLARINHLRNRIAHHEPICFATGQAVRDMKYVRSVYGDIIQLFQWMDIN